MVGDFVGGREKGKEKGEKGLKNQRRRKAGGKKQEEEEKTKGKRRGKKRGKRREKEKEVTKSRSREALWKLGRAQEQARSPQDQKSTWSSHQKDEEKCFPSALPFLPPKNALRMEVTTTVGIVPNATSLHLWPDWWFRLPPQSICQMPDDGGILTGDMSCDIYGKYLGRILRHA
jgi:hypothetical protein